MKILRFLGGVICSIAAISMLFCLQRSFVESTAFNPRVIDSSIDKFFWTLAIAGCAGLYATIAISLFRGVSPEKSKGVMVFGVLASLAMMAGLYYHGIFNSPW